jgi:DNA primase
LLYRHLLARKFTSKQIVEAGLAVVTQAGEHRDRFRNRVIFPVSNLTGQVVAFGARALGDEQPKYINSSESPIYSKGRILYGLDRAKAQMVHTGTAVVTEGYTDVIALHRVGINNAVATCGTALGEEHFALIKRFCERAILAFDADAAGSVASERGFGIHARVGLDVLVAPIPAGKDPADVALAEGSEAIREILDRAIPLMRFVLEREISRHNLDTAEGKARAVRAAASLLSWEPNRVSRSEHGFWVASRIGVAPEEVQLEIAESGDSDRGGRAPSSPGRRPGHVKVEREALAILLDSSTSLNGAMDLLKPEHFTQPEHRAIFEALVHVTENKNQTTIMDELPDDDSKRFAAELSLAPVVTKNPEEVFSRLEEFRIKRQIETLRAKLFRLDPRVDAAAYDALFEELMRLDVERRRFDDR